MRAFNHASGRTPGVLVCRCHGAPAEERAVDPPECLPYQSRRPARTTSLVPDAEAGPSPLLQTLVEGHRAKPEPLEVGHGAGLLGFVELPDDLETLEAGNGIGQGPGPHNKATSAFLMRDRSQAAILPLAPEPEFFQCGGFLALGEVEHGLEVDIDEDPLELLGRTG